MRGSAGRSRCAGPAAGLALRDGGAPRPGCDLLLAGRPACGETGGARRCHRPPDPWPCSARRVARLARAGPAQVGSAAHCDIPVRFRTRLLGAGVDPRSGTRLRDLPTPRARRQPATRVGAGRRGFFRPLVCGTRPRPAGRRAVPPAGRAQLRYRQQLELAHLVLGIRPRGCVGTSSRPTNTWSRHWLTTILGDLILWICSSASMSGSSAWDGNPLCCGCWVTLIRPSCLHRTLAAAARERSPRDPGLRPDYAAGTFFLMGGDAAAARGQVEALRLLYEAEPAFGAWVNSLAGWEPSGEEQADRGPATDAPGHGRLRDDGQRLGRAAQLLLLARAMPGRARRKRGWAPWMRRWPGWTEPACGASKRKRTG